MQITFAFFKKYNFACQYKSNLLSTAILTLRNYRE
jgi:hypothetical protein